MNYRYILLFFLVVSTFSCSEDFLNRDPLDIQTTASFPVTEDEARQALVSIYDVLGYQSSPGISWAPYLTISDILSDDAFAGGADANDGFDESELNEFRSSTTNNIGRAIWGYCYTGIFRANFLIEKIDGLEASDEFKDQLRAECAFFRAHFHFQLVRLFENIPLLTKTLSGPSEYAIGQNSPEDTYNQIATDLVTAIEGLPEVYSAAESGRITKWAASALLARVYLFYNGVYGDELNAESGQIDRVKALEYVEILINESGHALLENYADVFSLVGEYSSESIFEIGHGDSPVWWDWEYVRGGEGNLSSQMQGPRVSGSDDWDRGWSFAPVTHKLFLSLESDPRLTSTILLEGDLDGSLMRGYQHTGYFSNKYSSDAEHWGSGGQFELNRTTNNRVIRYSDVLLMAAELGSPNAQLYLDMVRERVGLASIPVTMENIRNERYLELALEGHRYFDLLRYGLDVAESQINNQSILGPLFTDEPSVYQVSFNSATKGFLPIPQQEIDLSGGLFMQNVGY